MKVVVVFFPISVFLMWQMKKAKGGDNDGELLEQWTEDRDQSTADDKENNHFGTNKENEIGMYCMAREPPVNC